MVNGQADGHSSKQGAARGSTHVLANCSIRGGRPSETNLIRSGQRVDLEYGRAPKRTSRSQDKVVVLFYAHE